MKVRFMGMEPGTGQAKGPPGLEIEGKDAEDVLRQLQRQDFFLADAPFEEYLQKLAARTVGSCAGGAEGLLAELERRVLVHIGAGDGGN